MRSRKATIAGLAALTLGAAALVGCSSDTPLTPAEAPRQTAEQAKEEARNKYSGY